MFPKFFNIIDEEDTFALTALTGLDNHDRISPLFGLLLCHVTLQLGHLVWHDPSLRVEAEVDRVLVLHLLQTLCQIALLGDSTHRWEVIDFLKRLELAELLRQDGHIVPYYVYVGVASRLILLQLLSQSDFIVMVLVVLVATLSPTVFFTSLLFRYWCISILVPLLRSDHFPFHLEGTLPDELVPRVGQVNPYLPSVKDAVIAGANDC